MSGNIELGRAVFDIMDKLKDERDFAIAEVERLEAIVKSADTDRAEAFRAGRIAAAQILREQLTEATRPDQRMTLAIAITAVERGRNLTATEKMKNLMAAMAESEREENARASSKGE